MNYKRLLGDAKLRPLFYAGLLWVVLGVCVPSMRLFAILGAGLMVISFKPRKSALGGAGKPGSGAGGLPPA
ncbi:hypothetical protein [Hymenobacter latericus]|uniref:hypothetical protein n=1 Tax=Hymenobacter sp. YIM 151858-1 TaxID=2987688 RepID=UPI0022262F30|nr:hypothetical protein [Hymenobacter sp. YIM 151858-1]UYZ60784.1 hypothetical protein OIS50_08270 [Hymenobacter sp. YIM 151858-1]